MSSRSLANDVETVIWSETCMPIEWNWIMAEGSPEICFHDIDENHCEWSSDFEESIIHCDQIVAELRLKLSPEIRNFQCTITKLVSWTARNEFVSHLTQENGSPEPPKYSFAPSETEIHTRDSSLLVKRDTSCDTLEMNSWETSFTLVMIWKIGIFPSKQYSFVKSYRGILWNLEEFPNP